jgi:hypothetical protein
MINLFKISDLVKNEPASDTEIAAVEDIIGGVLPRSYRDLLKYSNGFSEGGGLLIYGTSDLVERNETWETKEYAEGYIAIGDNGGGYVFLMLQYFDANEVFAVDAGDMNPQNSTLISSDFTQWISEGCLTMGKL